MPVSLPFLDYTVPENLRDVMLIGQLVKIPFRNRVEFGIVKKIIDGKKEKLKEIFGIVNAIPFLSVPQLQWLEEMAEFYKTPLSFLIKTNLLPLQKRKIEKIASLSPNLQQTDNPQQTSKPSLLIYSSKEEHCEYYIKNIPTSGQILILFPELPDLEKIQDVFSKKILDEAIVITSELTIKQSFEAWLKIWSGEKRIIIGTRAALFLPWHNLSAIFMDDEGNNNYKSWDMAPRFHTRDAALFLSKFHNAQLHLLTHTPAVETWFFAEHKIYTKQGEIKKNETVPEIINLKDERRRGNYSCLGEELIEALSQNTGDAFLFVNRLGSFGYVICRDCGQISICDKCSKPLSFLQSKNLLRCNNCHIETQVKYNCTKCQGQNIKTFGLGTQAAEAELKKLFPHKKIIRLDSDDADITKLKTTEKKIIIGTDYAWAHVAWEKLGLMAFLDVDTAMFIPEFKTMENLWLNLRDTAYRLPAGAKWFIQTSRPEHHIFSCLYTPENFYKQELIERKMMGYPPYNYLLRAIYGGTKAGLVEKEARKAYNTLNSLTNEGFTGKIIGPLKTEPYWRKGLYWQLILAKIPYKSYKKDTRLLASKLSDEWKIDPNPNSILNF